MSRIGGAECAASPISSADDSPLLRLSFGSARKSRPDHDLEAMGSPLSPSLSTAPNGERADGAEEEHSRHTAPRKRRLAMGIPERLEELAEEVAAAREETRILRRRVMDLEEAHERQHGVVVDKLEKVACAAYEENRALKADVESILASLADLQAERSLAEDRAAYEVQEFNNQLTSLKAVLDGEQTSASEEHLPPTTNSDTEAEITQKINALQGVVNDTLELIGDVSLQTAANAAVESDMRVSMKRRISDVCVRIEELLKDDQLRVAPQLRGIQACLAQEKVRHKGDSISVDEVAPPPAILANFVTKDELQRELQQIKRLESRPQAASVRISPRAPERLVSYRASVPTPIQQLSADALVATPFVQQRQSRSPSPCMPSRRVPAATQGPPLDATVPGSSSKDTLNATALMHPASLYAQPASIARKVSEASLLRKDSGSSLPSAAVATLAAPVTLMQMGSVVTAASGSVETPLASARVKTLSTARSLSPRGVAPVEPPDSARVHLHALAPPQLPSWTPRTKSPIVPVCSSVTSIPATARSVSPIRNLKPVSSRTVPSSARVPSVSSYSREVVPSTRVAPGVVPVSFSSAARYAMPPAMSS